MTQRSAVHAQSKLTVPATGLGSGVHPTAIVLFGESAYGDNLHRRLSYHRRHPWRHGGGEHPCSPPRIWGRSLERKFAGLLT
ncbi:hypothetical protein [Desulfosporosinus sp. FKA]|uniref:hypothetical protein n=1 Tax=Desulfosporosinus sp. FKA TaxID=1969834 RepID=UPI001124D219|nr:hypothetical protein [Desulfosporosinus sp. FKA]